ncbi:uncharacterized protein LOC123542737 [Mercenaria mercenaria]|uniref:uncharacterized protein LOC123542737 n=1 Tax=Mercenaria mercenaria TaxID=6596 RepID=UPI00234F069C|nr:uncharacterized protein LOC123542737 [Mercenaria mercenaria]
MYNKTIADWLTETKDDILNLSRCRLMEIGATVLFLFMITQGRKTWLNFLHFLMFMEGITYTFYPKTMNMLLVSGDLDDTHLILTRCFGLLYVTWSFGYFLLSKSTDSTTETSILLAWSVAMLTSLMAKGYLLTHPGPKKATVKMESEEMVTVFYTTLLFTVGVVFHTLKSNDWGGFGEQQSHANFHLRLQFVFLLIMGIVSYAMPQWTVKMMGDVDKVDSIHAFFTRVDASWLLAMAVIANRAANFLRNNDKDAVIFSQWLFFVSASVLGWIDTAGKWSELPWSRIALQAFHDAVLILNATGALNRDFSVVKRVVIPRFKVVPRDVRDFFKFKQQ